MKSRRPRASASQLRLSTSKRIDPAQVRALFRAAGWQEDLARYSRAQTQKLLRHSYLVLSAWNKKKLVGLASAVSDGVLCGLVQNLVIHPDHRGRGLGTSLLREMSRLMRRRRISCLYVLGNRGKRAKKFFRRGGFYPLDWKIYLQLTR
jgi:N-acetylglutamate synthase-like GNAT family acetyltransferase